MGLLLIQLKFWTKNLVQTPKPNENIHKKTPEVEFLIFLNFPYFSWCDKKNPTFGPKVHED